MSEVKVNKISPRTNCGTTQLGDAGDTITVTGDLKSNSLKSASGSTITLGQSGDTIQLGCGASQTGFGRTGTVDWDTTAKTASFTAVSGNGYFVNTTSGAVTMTLPATPSAGDIVAVADYANTFATNNLTVARNGSLINGGAFDYESSTNGISLTFVYVDGTRGWKNVNDGTTNATGQSDFIIATGGCVTCCGDYKIHTFTGPGTFTVTNAGNPCGSTTVDYLVIAGGGSGGNAFYASAGGGAGGYRESCGGASGCYTTSPLANPCGALPVSVQGYPITVGAGGPGSVAPPNVPGSNGSNSIFSTITSAGGGGGGADCAQGSSGGSGGGSSMVSVPRSGGAGNTPPVSPPQGQPGGGGPPFGGGATKGAGGGGATSAGGNVTTPNSTSAGPGGNGATSSINGTPTTRAGGGGGSTDSGPQGTGGPGGGGNGGVSIPTIQDGTVNTGSGGGGGGGNSGNGGGGSGIVIIRYKYQ
jgi:hypothetical protein